MTSLKQQQGLHFSRLRKENGEDAVLSYEMHTYEECGDLEFDIPVDPRLCKVSFAQHHRRWLRLRGTSLGASGGGNGSLVGYGCFSNYIH